MDAEPRPRTTVESLRVPAGRRFAVVASRFHGDVVDRLLEGALDALRRHGVADGDAVVHRVPGAWELPHVCRKLCRSGKVSAVIALGAVIRGETPHFEYVAGEAARGCAAAMADSGVPVAFGVLTTETMEQAVARSGSEGGNKGWEAAMTAIEMAELDSRLAGDGL